MSETKKTKSKVPQLWIICLKFAPGNWQHMESISQCLQKEGFSSRRIFSKKFRDMGEARPGDLFLGVSHNLKSILWDMSLFFIYRWLIFLILMIFKKPKSILFVMWHPLNYPLAVMAKAFGIHTTIWMHEPYKADKKSHGKKALVFSAIEKLQELMLPWLDTVILHSARAKKEFDVRYQTKATNIKLIPLLFPEIPFNPNSHEDGGRPYDLIFAGIAAPAKGILHFFELVRENARQNMGLKFLIATPTDISEYTDSLEPGCLEIINHKCLKDEEMYDAMKSSKCVFSFYLETTQSAVLPVAFMCGTPALASNIEGLREHITPGQTGELVDSFDAKEVLLTLKRISAKSHDMSKYTRDYFEKTWSDREWSKHYAWLLDILR